ncbi:unnamed protein product, partial [Discosporangium mesarthrocarpum]
GTRSRPAAGQEAREDREKVGTPAVAVPSGNATGPRSDHPLAPEPFRSLRHSGAGPQARARVGAGAGAEVGPDLRQLRSQQSSTPSRAEDAPGREVTGRADTQGRRRKRLGAKCEVKGEGTSTTPRVAGITTRSGGDGSRVGSSGGSCRGVGDIGSGAGKKPDSRQRRCPGARDGRNQSQLRDSRRER